ncbi:MAG TPA: hypothetical protein VII05_06350 [Gaiellaceae bacterium]|jgi:hypothetical protein
MTNILIYVGGAALIVWGIAHLAPTRQIVSSFEPISTDNRRILTMEWIAEGLVHISIGAIAIFVAAFGDSGATADLIYRCFAGVLLAIAALTTFTGARTPVIWFKICPFLLSGVAALLLARSWI